MGVDEEIQNIYYSIYNINLTLVNIDQGLGQLIDGMNFGLGVFDQHVNMVVSNVNDIQNNVSTRLTVFPSGWVYFIVLLFIVLLLFGLAAYLLYHVVAYILNRKDRYEEYRLWYLKNVMKQDENWEVECELEERYSPFGDDAPPPTYSEYGQTSDLYANYHDEVEAQRKYGKQFSFRKGRPRGTGVEYNTLI